MAKICIFADILNGKVSKLWLIAERQLFYGTGLMDIESQLASEGRRFSRWELCAALARNSNNMIELLVTYFLTLYKPARDVWLLTITKGKKISV
jgi:hypothetical protein